MGDLNPGRQNLEADTLSTVYACHIVTQVFIYKLFQVYVQYIYSGFILIITYWVFLNCETDVPLSKTLHPIDMSMNTPGIYKLLVPKARYENKYRLMVKNKNNNLTKNCALRNCDF